MPKKEVNKYFIPVELTVHKPSKWIDIKAYEYKLYADSSEQKFTQIKLIDINGFIVGTHMPTKLQTVYDKAALQVKNNTIKAVSEIRHAVDGVADVAVDVVSEVKNDLSKTAVIAVSLFDKIKSITKDKFKKEKSDIISEDNN